MNRVALLLTISACLLLPAGAWAQLEDTYEETNVEALEAPEDTDTRVTREEIEEEGRAEANWFEDELDLSQLERLGQAISRLRSLVASERQGSPARSDYMFRLAELLYTTGRIYEQRSFARDDEAYELESSNPGQASRLRSLAEADRDQSERSALEAIDVYVELYRDYHDTYPDMDGVLFYMGSTLSQLGRPEAALDFFEELANDYPNSRYLPSALLAFGEYYFQTGDMQQAQIFYHLVTEFPEAGVYTYAVYQEAWCFYNTEDFDQGLVRMLDAYQISMSEGAGRSRMRNRVLRDLALFYSRIGTADNAFRFFEQQVEVDETEAFDLVFIVAQMFGTEGLYDESNQLYRELMARNPTSFNIVNYQQEIVVNTLPSQNAENIVREVRGLVQLFQTARTFEDATPDKVQEALEAIEYRVRYLATTYHRDAQVTNNALLYAMAYNLYDDYHQDLAETADTETQYTMSFFYGELLFRNERWGDAALAWEHCVDIDPEGEYNEEALYKAILAYIKLGGDGGPTVVEREEGIGHDILEESEGEDSGDLPPIPVPQPLSELAARQVAAVDRYLLLDPPEEFAAQLAFVSAFALFEHDHYDDAADRFYHIAMNYAEVDFERARMSASLMIDCMVAMRDYTTLEERVAALASTVLADGSFGEQLGELGSQIYFSRCRDQMLDESYEDAGNCFFDFFRENFESDLVDRALYNAALSFQNAGMVSLAIQVREYLIQYRPDSELVPETRFTLGSAFHRLALYRDAASHYENYAADYPEEETAGDALYTAAIFRQGLGEYETGISDLELYMGLPSVTAEQSAEAFFRIALIFEEQELTQDAKTQYQSYLDLFRNDGPPGLAIQASTRMGVLNWDNNRVQAQDFFLQAEGMYNELSEEQRGTLDGFSYDAVAEARFMRGEQIFEQFSAIEVIGDEAAVQLAVTQKLEVGQMASMIYDEVQVLQSPAWTIAAFTRMGQLYHEFYTAVNEAPVPDFSSFEVEEAYLSGLEEHLTTIRLNAVDYYFRALQVAQTAGWFNEYSSAAEQNLQDLDPSFRAGSEVRAHPGYEPHDFTTGHLMEQPFPEAEIEVPGEGEDTGGDEGDGSAEEASVSDNS